MTRQRQLCPLLLWTWHPFKTYPNNSWRLGLIWLAPHFRSNFLKYSDNCLKRNFKCSQKLSFISKDWKKAFANMSQWNFLNSLFWLLVSCVFNSLLLHSGFFHLFKIETLEGPAFEKVGGKVLFSPQIFQTRKRGYLIRHFLSNFTVLQLCNSSS